MYALATMTHTHMYLLMAIVTQRLRIVLNIVSETFHVGITDATLYRNDVVNAL